MRIRPLTHLVPLLAGASLLFAGWSVVGNSTPRAQGEPPLPPARSAFADRVAARGLVEPSSEVISVATEIGGIVTEVAVRAGDEVRKGAPLFAVDSRQYRATVAQRQAELAAVEAQIDEIGRQQALQRSKIAEAEAEVKAGLAERERAIADRDRYAKLQRNDFASQQRLETATADARKADAVAARNAATLESAKNELDVLAATRLRVDAERSAAAARLDQANIDLDRTVVRAPLDATVLSVDIRLGEYAQTGSLAEPMLRLGALGPLHVRADVDEADAWRVQGGARATASLRGHAERLSSLTFVRFEPYVIAKQALSGGGGERVDTRVLQIVYAIDDPAFPARVGQQVDLYIDAGDSVRVAATN